MKAFYLLNLVLLRWKRQDNDIKEELLKRPLCQFSPPFKRHSLAILKRTFYEWQTWRSMSLIQRCIVTCKKSRNKSWHFQIPSFYFGFRSSTQCTASNVMLSGAYKTLSLAPIYSMQAFGISYSYQFYPHFSGPWRLASMKWYFAMKWNLEREFHAHISQFSWLPTVAMPILLKNNIPNIEFMDWDFSSKNF